MSHVSRADTSVFGRWWWTVDRTTIGIVLILMAIGRLAVLFRFTVPWPKTWNWALTTSSTGT